MYDNQEFIYGKCMVTGKPEVIRNSSELKEDAIKGGK